MMEAPFQEDSTMKMSVWTFVCVMLCACSIPLVSQEPVLGNPVDYEALWPTHVAAYTAAKEANDTRATYFAAKLLRDMKKKIGFVPQGSITLTDKDGASITTYGSVYHDAINFLEDVAVGIITIDRTVVPSEVWRHDVDVVPNPEGINKHY